VRVDRATPDRKSDFYGGSWGSLGDYGRLRNLTTNQKVADSSPAERAPLTPLFAGVFPAAPPSAWLAHPGLTGA
jgi:hypothetical protein